MNDISNINSVPAVIPLTGRTGTAQQETLPSTERLVEDEVEISDLGALLARVRDLPDIRVDKIARIRAEIEQGTYETAERLEGAVEQLLEEI